jgi:hypothetical protein
MVCVLCLEKFTLVYEYVQCNIFCVVALLCNINWATSDKLHSHVAKFRIHFLVFFFGFRRFDDFLHNCGCVVIHNFPCYTGTTTGLYSIH